MQPKTLNLIFHYARKKSNILLNFKLIKIVSLKSEMRNTHAVQ